MRTALMPVPSAAERSAAQPLMDTGPRGMVAPSVGVSTMPRTSHSSPASWLVGRQGCGGSTMRGSAGLTAGSNGESEPEPWAPATARPRPVTPLVSALTTSNKSANDALDPRGGITSPPWADALGCTILPVSLRRFEAWALAAERARRDGRLLTELEV